MRLAILVVSALAVISAQAIELPAGTQIQIRLQTAAASTKSKAGDAVKALVIMPVMADQDLAIPAGSSITGKVKDAQPVKDASTRASLELEFGELTRPGEKPLKLEARVSAVDNARETVDDKGKISGIVQSETLSARMDKGIGALEQRASALASLLDAVKGAVVKQADAEIDFGPGVEMTLDLTSILKLDPVKEPLKYAPAAIPNSDDLAQLVNAEPFQTMAEKPSRPSDKTNLMFIGSRDELMAAFEAAGWATAEKLNAKTGLETFQAIAEGRGYQQAPVSTLLLEGKKPDVVFQKQNNTFAQRHHMRIWMRPDLFAGKPVWVAAATHDIGIDFSAQNRTFIHKIDPKIDQERAKVVNDLLMTEKVQGLALVDRPAVPTESMNATGDKLETDGAMAVVLFKTGESQ